MYVDAEIETSNNETTAIEEDAVVEQGSILNVLVLKSKNNNEYSFEKIEVKVGNYYNGYKEILSSNIKSTDLILTKGAYNLIDTDS